MLNRTNRTLLANTNRLDLGTRMLGLTAGANNGNLTLRTAHHFPTVDVRTGVSEDPGIQKEAPPIMAGPKPMKPAMSSKPGSSPRPSSPSRDYRARDQGQTVLLSPMAQSVEVPPDFVEAGRSVTPRVASKLCRTGSSLAWRSDRARRAGRSARAALALVTGAAPIS